MASCAHDWHAWLDKQLKEMSLHTADDKAQLKQLRDEAAELRRQALTHIGVCTHTQTFATAGAQRVALSTPV